MIKSLPNGKEKSIIVQMCKCNLLLEVARFFLEDLRATKKNPFILEIIYKVFGVAKVSQFKWVNYEEYFLHMVSIVGSLFMCFHNFLKIVTNVKQVFRHLIVNSKCVSFLPYTSINNGWIHVHFLFSNILITKYIFVVMHVSPLCSNTF